MREWNWQTMNDTMNEWMNERTMHVQWMNNEWTMTKCSQKSNQKAQLIWYWHSKSKSPVLKLLREEQRKDLTGMSKWNRSEISERRENRRLFMARKRKTTSIRGSQMNYRGDWQVQFVMLAWWRVKDRARSTSRYIPSAFEVHAFGDWMKIMVSGWYQRNELAYYEAKLEKKRRASPVRANTGTEDSQGYLIALFHTKSVDGQWKPKLRNRKWSTSPVNTGMTECHRSLMIDKSSFVLA